MLIKELVTRLGFDVDFSQLNKFDNKIDQTQDGLKGMGNAADEAMSKAKGALNEIKNVLIGFAAVTAAGATGLVALVKSAANAGDEINRTAPLLGLSVEEFQKYRYAAKLAGVENENFAGTVQLLLRNVSEAQKGNSEIAKSFAQVGISVASLKGLSTDQVLRKISDGLTKIPNQADRIAVSMDLMGRSGARMGEFLGKGTAEMDAIMGDAEAFGMFTLETAKNADDMNDAFDRVAFFIQGMKNEFIALAPLFTGILNDIREWLSVNREVIQSGLASALSLIGKTITSIWNITKRVIRVFQGLVKVLGGFKNALILLSTAVLTPILMLLSPIALLVVAIFALTTTFFKLHKVLAVLAVALGVLVPALVAIKSAMVLMTAIKALGWVSALTTGFKALSLSMLVPILSTLALAAGLAAVLLVAEDITVWIRGGKSLIGSWIGEWAAIPDKLKKIWADIKSIFMAGGKFMSAVFKGDFVEAYKILEAGAEKVKDAVTDKNAGSAPPDAGKRYQSYVDMMGGGYGIPGATAFAGTSSGKREPVPFSARKFVAQYSLGTGADGKPALTERQPQSGSSGTKIGKLDLNLTLAKGTTREQAEEIHGIVDQRLQKHIDHSLQQSSGPGE